MEFPSQQPVYVYQHEKKELKTEKRGAADLFPERRPFQHAATCLCIPGTKENKMIPEEADYIISAFLLKGAFGSAVPIIIMQFLSENDVQSCIKGVLTYYLPIL